MQQDDSKPPPHKPILAWMIIAGIAVITLGWGLFNYLLIPDPDRHWDYGELPDTPGESIYSTRPIPKTKAPTPQFELPPELEQSATQPETSPSGEAL